MMTSILIAALFATGTAFAVATIVATLRAYWPAVLALRDAEGWQVQEQTVRVTTTAIRVDHAGTVLRPSFRAPARAPLPGWRAAA